MREIILKDIKERIKTLLEEELEAKLRSIPVDEGKDRIRVAFEFEFSQGKIKDALEVRWRRPWE